jgi:hypothetical protein
MRTGFRNGYFWTQWENASLSDLLTSIPDIVVGRYLVNTSFDSGKLSLSESECHQGWRASGSLTYSPRIVAADQIPFDQFDEWLSFTEPTEVKLWRTIVNYSGFSLSDPDYASMQQELWSQLERVKPESYLADGDCLFFITRTKHLHDLSLAHQAGTRATKTPKA